MRIPHGEDSAPEAWDFAITSFAHLPDPGLVTAPTQNQTGYKTLRRTFHDTAARCHQNGIRFTPAVFHADELRDSARTLVTRVSHRLSTTSHRTRSDINLELAQRVSKSPRRDSARATLRRAGGLWSPRGTPIPIRRWITGGMLGTTQNPTDGPNDGMTPTTRAQTPPRRPRVAPSDVRQHPSGLGCPPLPSLLTSHSCFFRPCASHPTLLRRPTRAWPGEHLEYYRPPGFSLRSRQDLAGVLGLEWRQYRAPANSQCSGHHDVGLWCGPRTCGPWIGAPR